LAFAAQFERSRAGATHAKNSDSNIGDRLRAGLHEHCCCAGRPLQRGHRAIRAGDPQFRWQPTPESMKKEQANLKARFSALMARAKRLDAKGDAKGCSAALNQAKRMYII
jgi:hypothetical protein